MCSNYDLCSNCIDYNEHPKDHIFLRITNPNAYKTVPIVFNRNNSIHNQSCTSCHMQNPKGWLYSCQICKNVHLCEACENLGKHEPSHSRLKTVQSGYV